MIRKDELSFVGGPAEWIIAKQREDAEAIAEEPIKDVVITVPPFWAQDERQALLVAAELAKMNVLGLLNENSAVAMKYAIDKKYDVAVSTACAALDYIVVETTADAQACVAHLRANNLGVATFLILEKQRSLEGRMRETRKAPAAANAPKLATEVV